MLTLEEKKQWKKEYNKKWREKNKERIAEYYEKNKEAIAEKTKEYYKNNREAREAKRETAKKWREKNKEYKAAKDKVYRIKYYQKNKEAIAKRMKEWGKEYREKQKNNIEAREAKREYDKEWSKNKYRTDLTWKMGRILIKSLRNKLKRHLIKGTNPEFSYTKAASSLLGCTVEELKTHIENQFEDGMTWENWTRDGWHLDHIVPCSSFDLSKNEEQEKCFHYTNLQPLWAEDNLSKGSKLNWNKKGVSGMPIKHKLMLVYNYDTERFGSRRGDFEVTLTGMKPFTSMKMLKKSVMNNWYYDGFKPRVRIKDKFKSLKEVMKYYNSEEHDFFLRIEKSCKKVYEKYVLPEMGDEYNTMLNFLPTEKQTDEEVAKLVHKCKTDFKFCAKLHNDIVTDWEDWYDEIYDY